MEYAIDENDEFKVNKIDISKNSLNNLNSKLMLFHTGVFRNADLVSKKLSEKQLKDDIINAALSGRKG